MEWLNLHQKHSLNGVFGNESSPYSCKSESTEGSENVSPLCPQCKSKKVWRDGTRSPMFGDPIQRWLCRECGLRFSDPNDVLLAKKAIETIEMIETKSLKTTNDKVVNCQICVTETKNLVAEQQKTEVLRRETADVKGKLVEFAWWMKKEGYRDATIIGRSKLLRILTRRQADLYDPESVKKVISNQPWCEGRKANAVDAYSSFLKMTGGTWKSSKIHRNSKAPVRSKRNRNRPANRSLQPSHRNFPSTAKRNRHKMRRSMANRMGPLRLRNQHHTNYTREEQQPKNIQNKPQTNRNASTAAKNLR